MAMTVKENDNGEIQDAQKLGNDLVRHLAHPDRADPGAEIERERSPRGHANPRDRRRSLDHFRPLSKTETAWIEPPEAIRAALRSSGLMSHFNQDMAEDGEIIAFLAQKTGQQVMGELDRSLRSIREDEDDIDLREEPPEPLHPPKLA